MRNNVVDMVIEFVVFIFTETVFMWPEAGHFSREQRNESNSNE